MADPRQELEELRRLDELERKAASQDLGEIRKQKEKVAASQYYNAGSPKTLSDLIAPDRVATNVSELPWYTRAAGGAKHALDSVNMGLKGLLPQAVQDAGDAVDRYLGLGGLNQDLVDKGRAFVKQGGPAAAVGEIGGDIAMTAIPAVKGAQVLQAGARMLPRSLQFLGGSLPTNMASSGIVSAATAPDNRGSAAAGGALGAGAGEVAGRVLTKTLGGVASGGVTPEAKALMDQGVSVPMWKATENKVVRDMAERAKVLPGVGHIMRGQERGAFESFNKGMASKATPPMPILDDAGNVLRWETKPVREAGSDAIDALRKRFDDAYGALYNGRGIPLDRTYGTAVTDIVETSKGYYPRLADDIEAGARQAHDILAKASHEGHAVTSPEAVKQAIDSLETRITSAYKRGDDEAAQVYKDLKGAIEDLRMRGLPPEVADQAAAINKAYAGYKQLERATGSLGAQKAGLTSPAQLLNAIKANDRSPNKSRFARGTALNQQDALLADRVLGSRLPETGPGTAEKLMPFIGFGGPMLLGDLGATALLGTQSGQRFLMGQLPGQAGVRKYGSEYLVPALRAYGLAEGN